MTATVEFRISARGRSDVAGLVAVFDLERLDDLDPDRPVAGKFIRNLRAPVGRSLTGETVTLDPGFYLSRLRLPSGEKISEVLHIHPDTALQTVMLGRAVGTGARYTGSQPPKSHNQVIESRAVKPRQNGLDPWRGPGSFEFREYVLDEIFDRYDVPYTPVPGRSGDQSRFKLAFQPRLPKSNFITVAPSQQGLDLADYLSLRIRGAKDASIVESNLEVLAWSSKSTDLVHRLKAGAGHVVHPVAQLTGPGGLQISNLQVAVRSSSLRTTRLDLNAGLARDEAPVYLVVSRVSAREGDVAPRLRAALIRVPGYWNEARSYGPTSMALDIGAIVGPSLARLTVDDPTLQSVIDFTQQKDLEGALVVLDLSLQLLMHKVENPYAAAAAGYVLLLTPPSRTPYGWFNWIGNLGKWFDDLPDGQIQHATLLLQRSWDDQGPELEEQYFPHDRGARIRLAASLLLSSLERGLPLYRSGLTYLATNLFILEDRPELEPGVCDSVKAARAYVNSLRHRVDTSQPFTTLDISTLT